MVELTSIWLGLWLKSHPLWLTFSLNFCGFHTMARMFSRVHLNVRTRILWCRWFFCLDRGNTRGTYIRNLSETTWLAKKGNCSKNGGKSTVMFGCMIRYNFNWYWSYQVILFTLLFCSQFLYNFLWLIYAFQSSSFLQCSYKPMSSL